MLTLKLNQYALSCAMIFSVIASQSAEATTSTITALIDGRSGPWDSALNPSFNWGSSILPPTVVDSSTGLAMAPGDTLTINYLSGCASGGWPGCYDANGWSGFGNQVGAGGPAYFINPSKYPVVYFMALLGTFTNSNGVIVGNPFFIGDGPFKAVIPTGASKLSMGFNDGGGGFFDNGGVITVSISEAVPEPGEWTMMFGGLGLMSFIAMRRAKAVKTA